MLFNEVAGAKFPLCYVMRKTRLTVVLQYGATAQVACTIQTSKPQWERSVVFAPPKMPAAKCCNFALHKLDLFASWQQKSIF